MGALPFGNELKKLTARDADDFNAHAPEVARLDGWDAPEWFTPGQVACWAFFVDVLVEMQVLARADMAVVTTLAVASDQYVEATRRLAADGTWLPNRFGELMEHPAVKTQNRAANVIHRLARVLGLDPLNRGQLVIQPAAPAKQGAERLFG